MEVFIFYPIYSTSLNLNLNIILLFATSFCQIQYESSLIPLAGNILFPHAPDPFFVTAIYPIGLTNEYTGLKLLPALVHHCLPSRFIHANIPPTPPASFASINTIVSLVTLVILTTKGICQLVSEPCNSLL